MPAGPAPTTRTVVLDGKDWDIVSIRAMIQLYDG
jgi:hypothetical protein